MPGVEFNTQVPFAATKEVDQMTHEPAEHHERDEDDYAKGQDEPEAHPEEERHGRFSTGGETIPDEHPEENQGRFSEGEEQLPDSDPEKHVERDFAEGQEAAPPED
jgi:hypothetical protein